MRYYIKQGKFKKTNFGKAEDIAIARHKREMKKHVLKSVYVYSKSPERGSDSRVETRKIIIFKRQPAVYGRPRLHGPERVSKMSRSETKMFLKVFRSIRARARLQRTDQIAVV